MKMLIEVNAPAWDGSMPGYEAATDVEVGAFVSRLIHSRIGREPSVKVTIVNDDFVLVNADALLKLQQKAGGK